MDGQASENTTVTGLFELATPVPSLDNLCRYDGQGFHGFLERQGWQLQGEDANEDTIARIDGTSVSRIERIAVLQAWLFFGVLDETFQIVDVSVDLQDFIELGVERCVKMEHLAKYVRSWEESEHSRSPDVRRDHLRKVLSFLQLSGDIVDSMLSFPRLRYAEDLESMTVLVIAESIAMLGDSLMNAAKNIWHDFQDDMEDVAGSRIRKRLRYCEPAALSLKRLEKRGWCKSTRMMMHRLVDCSGLYHAAMLDRPKMVSDHSNCTSSECVEMNIDKGEYKVRHVCENGDCLVVEVDRTQLSRVIDDGDIPCVRLDHDGQIGVCGARDGYVAISHVWAHGLGNPNVNGLPRCQIERLQGLVDGVQTSRGAHHPASSSSARHHFAFWMDTLCIPVGEAYADWRNQAILSLTRVFKDASTVLVLDVEVNDVSTSASHLEKELRVITCDWMRRVWTLQEAILTKPGNLYWQFREQALAAEDIWVENKKHDPLRVSYRTSAFDKRLPVLSINSRDSSPRDAQKLSNEFCDVLYALRYRSLSRNEDETICIAPMIGLEREALLQSKEHTQRIKIFLSLWEKVPSYILFMEGEHMEEDGARWMPVSFVRGHQKSVAPRAPEKFTTFGVRGLSIEYPGIFIRQPSEYSYLHCDLGFYNSLDRYWYTVQDLGPIFESRLPESQRWATWRKKLHTLGSPALILEFPSNYSSNYLVAVLVDVSHNEDGTLYARYLCRVWLESCNEDRRFLTLPDPKDVKEWVVSRYEEQIGHLPQDQQAVLRHSCPPPLEFFEATALDQKWCIG